MWCSDIWKRKHDLIAISSTAVQSGQREESNEKCGESLGGPVVKSPHFQHGGCWLVPGQGTSSHMKVQNISHSVVSDPMDCSWPGSSVHRIFLARILEWVAISHSRRSSQSKDQICTSCISCIGRQILYHYATWEAQIHLCCHKWWDFLLFTPRPCMVWPPQP